MNYDFAIGGGSVFTAGRRVNETNSPSSFIWRLETANVHRRLPISVDYWAKPGEPNNGGGIEFCLILFADYNYSWGDDYCGNQYNAVCEIDIT